jgi:hypothetical protein
MRRRLSRRNGVAKKRDHVGCTGGLVWLVPDDSPEREILLLELRFAARFRQQQQGRRPGFLHCYLAGIVARVAPQRVPFEALLEMLTLEAGRINLEGEMSSPIEQVSRSNEVMWYQDPRAGRVQVTFKTIRNHLASLRPQKKF